MNREFLCAVAGVLLLAGPEATHSQNLKPNDSSWSRAVNLLPLIDPERDSVAGQWKMDGGSLLSDDAKSARVRIPFEPPDEYEMRVSFSRLQGRRHVVMMLSKSGRGFTWQMGRSFNTVFAFMNVTGTDNKNPTETKVSNALQNNRRYTAIVSVRKTGIAGFLDGKQIAQWTTDYHDVGMENGWGLQDDRLLGVGSLESPTRFYSIELLEITGKGRTVPHMDKATAGLNPDKTKSTGPSPSTSVTQPSEKPLPRTSRTSSGISSRTADPELQKTARDFARNQSSIKGLYVMHTGSGQTVGSAQDIIATVEYGRSGYETTWQFATAVGNSTRISLNEAAHLVKVRYPVWKAGHHIRFSFADKYSPQSGGSAGGALAVLFMSLMEGFQIDPAFAMTGDVTVDGKIREIGGLTEKVRGAALEKCTIVALPLANKENLSDMVLLYSPAMLWSAQLFSIATLDEAVTVARQDRAENLAKAIALFASVQPKLGPNSGIPALRDLSTYQTLREVLRLAPNHLSAEFMLRAANYQLPNTLSLRTSLEEIWAAATPMVVRLFGESLPMAKKEGSAQPSPIPTETLKTLLNRLVWLEPRLHPQTKNLRTAMVDYANSLDDLQKRATPPATVTENHRVKKDRLLGEINKIGTDRKILEEMIHR